MILTSFCIFWLHVKNEINLGSQTINSKKLNTYYADTNIAFWSFPWRLLAVRKMKLCFLQYMWSKVTKVVKILCATRVQHLIWHGVPAGVFSFLSKLKLRISIRDLQKFLLKITVTFFSYFKSYYSMLCKFSCVIERGRICKVSNSAVWLLHAKVNFHFGWQFL